MLLPPPISTLFPYTTLFRSPPLRAHRGLSQLRQTRLHGELPASFGRHDLRAGRSAGEQAAPRRSEEHTSELQSRQYLVCRLLLEKKKKNKTKTKINRHERKN